MLMTISVERRRRVVNQILTNIELSDRLYYEFAKIVYDGAGISLGDAKRELVRSRLLERLQALNLFSFEHYHHLITRCDPEGEELANMLDAISTNKTDFFRESRHFLFLAETVMPVLIDKYKRAGARRIRFWSAGCSSGEEPYTMAMVLRDALDESRRWDARILATDISTAMLRTAAEGRYEESKVKPVPSRMRLANLTRETTLEGVFYRVRPELKRMVVFRKLNLTSEKHPFSGRFDVVFCRNVMIYFDRPTQQELVNKFYQYTRPGGYLFIGQSENLNALRTPFRFVKPTIYLRP